MNRKLLPLLALLAPSLAGATEYFCAPSGSGTTCSSGSPCATVQACVDKLAVPGDICTIRAGTYSGSVTIPNSLHGTAGAKYTIQGDPAASINSMTVTGQWVFALPSGSLNGHVTSKHLRFQPTTTPAIDIRGVGAGSEWRDLTFDDLVVDFLPTATPTAANAYVFGCRVTDSWSDSDTNYLFNNIRISNGGTLRARSAFSNFTDGFTVTNSDFRDLKMVMFGSSKSGFTFTGNLVKHCYAGDSPPMPDQDGIFQLYNQESFNISYNVFDDVGADDTASYYAQSVCGIRQTDTSTHAGGTISHNTFIAPTNLAWDINRAISFHNGDNLTATDNIFIGYGGADSRGGALAIDACPDNGPYTANHNLYYQSRSFDINDNGASCGGDNNYGTGDKHSGTCTFGSGGSCANPGTLNEANGYIPQTAGSNPACGAGTGGSDIGAKACGAGGPVCGNGVREGAETCDDPANDGSGDFGGDTCAAHSCGGTLRCTGSCSTITTTSCTGCGDVTAPTQITSLTASAPAWAPQLGIQLSWTATSDDVAVTAYDIRMKSGSAPTDCTSDGVAITQVVNAAGNFVNSLPTPLGVGQAETVIVKGLRPNTSGYYFGICARDASGNRSTIRVTSTTATAKYAGYGYLTTGGGSTGSTVPPICEVTSLADSGTGSLRACVALGDDRVVIPSVGGTVSLSSRIDLRGLDRWTLDGSAAPFPGFTITSASDLDDSLRLGDATHIILTHFRIQGRWFWVPTNPGNCTNAPTTCSADVDCGGGNFCANPREIADFLSFNNTTGVVANFVIDHVTIRDTGDSGMDLFDDATDGTFSYIFSMKNHYGQATGGDPGTARVTWHHMLWAQNGERNPQLGSTVSDGMVDLDYRNNILYGWAYDPNPSENYTVGSYAIRIRNQGKCTVFDVGENCTSSSTCSGGTCTPLSPARVNRLNIVNNLFKEAGTVPHASEALIYGTTVGGQSGDAIEENGPASCQSQGTVVGTTNMGDIWVSGNTFPSSTCDKYSTVAAENTVPAGAAVTTDSVANLCTTVLPEVGVRHRSADETTLAMQTVWTALSCTPVAPPPQVTGAKIQSGTIH